MFVTLGRHPLFKPDDFALGMMLVTILPPVLTYVAFLRCSEEPRQEEACAKGLEFAARAGY